MRLFLKLLFAIPTVIAIVLFAVANRGGVRVSFDPLSREAPALFIDAPLWMVVIAALMLGVVVGGIAAWLAQGRHRREERRLRREVDRLVTETQSLKAVAPQSALATLPSLR
jgi:uncharacterized integral membrane protein